MLKTIMVVDDEENLRILAKEVLENKGYKVILAKNGDDCLVKLRTEKVDLILMDVMMPGTPVGDVIKRIKDTKIVFLSVVGFTDAQKDEMRKMKNIVDFIQKPFDIDKLAGKVKEYLGE